jgi:hypothetical protein
MDKLSRLPVENGPEQMQVAWRGKCELIANVGVWITSFVPQHTIRRLPRTQLRKSKGEAHTICKWISRNNRSRRTRRVAERAFQRKGAQAERESS